MYNSVLVANEDQPTFTVWIEAFISPNKQLTALIMTSNHKTYNSKCEILICKTSSKYCIAVT